MGSGHKQYLFEIVDKLRKKYSLSLLLHFANLSKSGYYKWKKYTYKADKDLDIIEHIKAIHSVRPYFGYRRIQTSLKREGIIINHKRVYRLMGKVGIQSIIRKKRKYFGKSGSNIFPNLLNRDFTIQLPYKKLSTDITYLPTTQGFLFLSVVQDLHNNEILAYELSHKNDLEIVFATLAQLPRVTTGAILHSDQGFQYTHKRYHNYLDNLGILGSHSRRGNCLDNACVESFFSHLKTEAFASKTLVSKEETITKVKDYIHFYNHIRFQKRLNQLSPIEYREKLVA